MLAEVVSGGAMELVPATSCLGQVKARLKPGADGRLHVPL